MDALILITSIHASTYSILDLKDMHTCMSLYSILEIYANKLIYSMNS